MQNHKTSTITWLFVSSRKETPESPKDLVSESILLLSEKTFQASYKKDFKLTAEKEQVKKIAQHIYEYS